MLKRVYAMNAGCWLTKPKDVKRPVEVRTRENSAKVHSICIWVSTRFFSVWPSFQCPASAPAEPVHKPSSRLPVQHSEWLFQALAKAGSTTRCYHIVLSTQTGRCYDVAKKWQKMKDKLATHKIATPKDWQATVSHQFQATAGTLEGSALHVIPNMLYPTHLLACLFWTARLEHETHPGVE